MPDLLGSFFQRFKGSESSAFRKPLQGAPVPAGMLNFLHREVDGQESPYWLLHMNLEDWE